MGKTYGGVYNSSNDGRPGVVALKRPERNKSYDRDVDES